MDKYCYYCMDKLPQNDSCNCERSRQGIPPMTGAIAPGTILNGKYLIGYPLGAGGFGMTYIGRDLNLDMKVAVKEYIEGAAGGKERFLREARAMARFAGQAGIVNVRDFFEENGTAYIVMEYLEGMTLKDYISKFGPISWNLAMDYMLPILKVLSKLHKEGFIHRDVSPDNIMMLKDGSVKLLDFGAAADVGAEQQKTMTVMLKPGYAPPEQYQGKGGMGPWTDVYAACATFYKCITGETPQDSLSRMFDDQLKTPSQLGVSIPEAAQQALMQGLCVRREGRFMSVEALISALEAARGQAAGRENAPKVAGMAAGQSAANAGDRTQTRAAYDGQMPTAGRGPQAEETPTSGRGQRARKAKQAPGEQKAADSDKKKISGPGKKNASGSGKKNKKVLWLSLAGAGVVLFGLCLVLIFSGSFGNANPYRDSGSYSELVDLTVTDKMIDIINHDEGTENLALRRCVITDEQIAMIAKNPRLQSISIKECSGFTTLDPLAAMPALQKIWLDVGIGGSVDGSVMFSTTFNFVGELHLDSDVVLTTGTDFLSHFPNLLLLYLNGAQGVENLDFVKSMPNLRALQMDDVALGDKDYSALAACTALEQFYGDHTGISDLTVLAGCTNLAELRLNGCGIADLTPLAALTNMKSLSLKNNQITDLAPLAGMTGLQALYLSGNQITDLTPLSGMAQMRDLYVDNNQITTLTPLAAMGEILNINARNNQLQNLEGCEAMIKLLGFWAANNQLTDVSAIKSATSLRTLDLQNNQITDVSFLTNGFPELLYVNLSNNQVTDISGLAASEKLRALLVENNGLTSLAGLENKPELQGIMANNNQISDISALGTSMESLQYVDLGTNQISDISVLSKLAYKQTGLLLENNQITDLSDLPSSLNYKLVIYGNPITDYSPIASWSNINTFMGDLIYIDYNADADLTPLLESKYDKNIYIIDAPVEQQAAILRQVDGLYKPEFITKEMADASLAAFRDEIRTDLGGEPDDDESESE